MPAKLSATSRGNLPDSDKLPPLESLSAQPIMGLGRYPIITGLIRRLPGHHGRFGLGLDASIGRASGTSLSAELSSLAAGLLSTAFFPAASGAGNITRLDQFPREFSIPWLNRGHEDPARVGHQRAGFFLEESFAIDPRSRFIDERIPCSEDFKNLFFLSFGKLPGCMDVSAGRTEVLSGAKTVAAEKSMQVWFLSVLLRAAWGFDPFK